MKMWKLLRKTVTNCILGISVAFTISMGMSMAYPTPVYAAGDAFVAALKDFYGNKANDAGFIKAMELLIDLGRARGLTDDSIAGIMANIHEEGSWKYVEGYQYTKEWVDKNGNKTKEDNFQIGGEYILHNVFPHDVHHATAGQGVGLIQWSPGDTKLASESVCKNACAQVGNCGYFIVHCNRVNCASYGGFSGKACSAGMADRNYQQVTYYVPGPEAQIWYLLYADGNNGFQKDSNVTNINAQGSASEAASWYCTSLIHPAKQDAAAVVRAALAPEALNVVKMYDGAPYIPPADLVIEGPDDVDNTSSSSDTVDQAEYELDNTYNALYENGYISEDHLGAYYKLKEQNLNLDELSREEFGKIQNGDEWSAGEANEYSENLRQLNQWEANVNGEKLTLTQILRTILMFIGIMMIIWVVFFYLSYWFDRINTIVPFSTMSIISFGKYVISDNEETSDVHVVDPQKGKQLKQINHKGVLIICLITITFSILILSGILFRYLSLAILWVQRMLAQLTA